MTKYSDTYDEPAAWFYKGCSGNSESQGYWEKLQFFKRFRLLAVKMIIWSTCIEYFTSNCFKKKKKERGILFNSFIPILSWFPKYFPSLISFYSPLSHLSTISTPLACHTPTSPSAAPSAQNFLPSALTLSHPPLRSREVSSEKFSLISELTESPLIFRKTGI